MTKVLFSLRNLCILLVCLTLSPPVWGLAEEEDGAYWDNPDEAQPHAEALKLEGPLEESTDSTDPSSEPALTSSTTPNTETSNSTTSEVTGPTTQSTSSELPSTSESPTTDDNNTDEPTEDPTETTDPDENETTKVPSSSTSSSSDPSTNETSTDTSVTSSELSSSVSPDPAFTTNPSDAPNPSSTSTLSPLDPESGGRKSAWAIASVSILISFAIIFTGLYFLRGYLIRKRRDDQKRLLRGSSSEGFFYGDGSGTAQSNRFHDSI